MPAEVSLSQGELFNNGLAHDPDYASNLLQSLSRASLPPHTLLGSWELAASTLWPQLVNCLTRVNLHRPATYARSIFVDYSDAADLTSSVDHLPAWERSLMSVWAD